MSSDDVSMTPGGIHKPPIKVESKDLSSSKMVSGLAIEKVGGLFGVLPFQSMRECSMPIVSPTAYEGYPIDPKYLKELIFNQSNTTKIRPVLLCFEGHPDSGKTRAVSHLLDNYVDSSPFQPIKKKSERSEAEGITYFEIVATGFYPLKKLTITEVTKESSCAFGILSAFRKELLQNHKVPLFNYDLKGPLSSFDDHELEGHLQYIFSYICQYEHTPKGTKVTPKEQEYAAQLKKLLPEGIALINIWDIAINKTVHYFLASLCGLLYNSHMWLFMDMDKDLENIDKPPEVLKETTRIAVSTNHSGKGEQSVLMKWRPRLHYLLRSSRMSESIHGPREDVCTIFAKHRGTYNENLKLKVSELEMKVKQAAKHIGVSSLIEPKIEIIDFECSDCDDNSLRLYQKFQQVICKTHYQDVPLSWIFLRSLFYRSQKKFIAKSELRKKAEECGMDDESLTKFCEFYTSFGSIFDLSLVNPDYPYVIVKPMGFLRTLDMLLYPEDSICQKYPSIMNGIIPEKACKDVFGESWQVFMEALVSVNLGTRVSSSHLDIPDLDPNDIYYFIPLSRKGKLIMEADPTAVHLIVNVDAPHVFQQTAFTNSLLRSLQKPKLVQCNNPNQIIIKETATDITVTFVSHSPATKISISQANPDVCSLILETYVKIAERCKIGTVKYKFVMICAKSGVPDVQDIPSCQYHILPNDTLCDECVNAGRVNDQLKVWNEALRKYPIPSKCQPDRGLKPSELAYIAEKIASCDPSIVGEIFGFKDLSQYQEMKGAKRFNAMLLEWDRVNQSQIEIRQTLSRKLLELDESYNGPLEQKPDFETLAKEIDIHARPTNTMKQNTK